MEMCLKDGIAWSDIEEELVGMRQHRSDVRDRLKREVTQATGVQEVLLEQALDEEPVQSWQTDVRFMEWLLALEKVPNRNMRQMQEWFHWQDTRGNAVFQDEGAGGGKIARALDDSDEGEQACLLDEVKAEWSASWRPSREVFASLYWEEHPFGGFTHDVCRSGGCDMLQPYNGPSVTSSLSNWFQYQGSRLWVQPADEKAKEAVKQVELAWEGVGRQMAASLLVTEQVACRLGMKDREGWSLHYHYKHEFPTNGHNE